MSQGSGKTRGTGKKEGVTEALKATDQMKRVGMVNNITRCAEEIVLEKLVHV